MKKIAIVFIFVLLIGVTLSSCRSSKPPCPAYQASNIEQVDTQNFTR